MGTNPTTDLPNLAALSAEQKERLLALLVKDELDRQPIPMPIFVRLDGEDLGHFRPKIKHPEKTTPYPFTEEERQALIRLARDPGPTFTYREWLALERSEADAKPK
jgi:hypothetical protein